jgi:hypothetical protein
VLGRTVHELRMWAEPADRMFMIEQLRRGMPIRNVITRIRTKSGELKLTAYSADRIHFNGEPYILAVSENGRHPAGRSESINVLWGDFEVMTQVLRPAGPWSESSNLQLNSCAGLLARKLAWLGEFWLRLSFFIGLIESCQTL